MFEFCTLNLCLKNQLCIIDKGITYVNIHGFTLRLRLPNGSQAQGDVRQAGSKTDYLI